jgi:hypothetical protein
MNLKMCIFMRLHFDAETATITGRPMKNNVLATLKLIGHESDSRHRARDIRLLHKAVANAHGVKVLGEAGILNAVRHIDARGTCSAVTCRSTMRSCNILLCFNFAEAKREQHHCDPRDRLPFPSRTFGLDVSRESRGLE